MLILTSDIHKKFNILLDQWQKSKMLPLLWVTPSERHPAWPRPRISTLGSSLEPEPILRRNLALAPARARISRARSQPASTLQNYEFQVSPNICKTTENQQKRIFWTLHGRSKTSKISILARKIKENWHRDISWFWSLSSLQNLASKTWIRDSWLLL